MKRLLVVLSVMVLVPTGVARAFDGGDGSPGDPYQISTCAQLQEVGYPEHLTESFELTQNVDCSVTTGWGPDGDLVSYGFSPIGSAAAGAPFSGTFDGAGFAIDELFMTNYSSYAGLFARTSGATITDVGLRDADIRLNGIPAAGILIGSAMNTDISDSYASGSLNDNAPTTYHIHRVTGADSQELFTQGFSVRFTTKQFEVTEVSGSLTLEINQSGTRPFAGVDAIELEACGQPVSLASAYYSNTGVDVIDDVRSVDLNVVGAHERPIRATWDVPAECHTATLALTANEYGHGVPFQYPRGGTSVPYTLDSERNTPVTDGHITEYDGAAPLFAPHWQPASGHPAGDVPVFVSNDGSYLYIAADLTIDNTDDAGEDWISVTIGGREFRVSDSDPTYGVCAFGVTGRVPYKHNTCELRIPRSELPVGAVVPLVLGYYGTAAESFWGGLVGLADGTTTIERSYAYSTVATDDTGTFANVGGLVGEMASSVAVTDSYARGVLDHDDFGGPQAGLVGHNDGGSITNSYAAVSLTGTTPGTNGGLVGFGTGSATSSYWDTDVSGTLVSAQGTGKTTTQMQDISTFTGWDFDAIWDIDGATNGGYPFFGNAPAPTPTPSASHRSSGGVMPGSSLWIALGLGGTPSPAPMPSPTPGGGGLTEGDVIRATGDADIYIVNGLGFKRLFLNPVIFSFYAHLGWDKVKEVTSAIRDSFGTSGLFRNCETDNRSVYALEITGGDVGVLHHVAMTGEQAVSQDPDFFKKVFCINTNEFNWYPKSPVPYTSLSQLPEYRR